MGDALLLLSPLPLPLSGACSSLPPLFSGRRRAADAAFARRSRLNRRVSNVK